MQGGAAKSLDASCSTAVGGGPSVAGPDNEAVLAVLKRLMNEQQQRHAQEQASILQMYSELSWTVKQLRERVGNLGSARHSDPAGGFYSVNGSAEHLPSGNVKPRNHHEMAEVAALQRKVWGSAAAKPRGAVAGGRPELDDTQSASSASNRDDLGVTPQRRPPVSRGNTGLRPSVSPVRSETEERNFAREILDDISEEASPSLRASSGSRMNAEQLYDEIMGRMMRDEPTTTMVAGVKASGGVTRVSGLSGFHVAGLHDPNVAASPMDLHPLSFPHDVSLNSNAANTTGASADASGMADEIVSQETLRHLRDLPGTSASCAMYREGRPHVKPIASGNPAADEAEAHHLNRHQPYHVLVEFKRHRSVQYESDMYVSPGKYVVVAADRGEDLGLVICTWCETFNSSLGAGGPFSTTPNHFKGLDENPLSIRGVRLTGAQFPHTLRVCRGTVLRLASESDVSQLHFVQAELERRAIDVCQQRVLERKVPMVLVDAEYQFDSKKLTFFYEAQQRTDFRELVRDLFKSFRARIWMEMVEDNE